MSFKRWDYQGLCVVLLSLIFIALGGCDSSAQEQDSEAATAKKETDEIRALIKSGGDVNATDADGITLLMKASENGHTEVVKLLLESKADVNAAKTNGVTPLWMASQEGHTEVVKLLLEAKADVNAAHTNGVTPLFMASQNGHTEVVKLLLESKADVNAKGWKDYTPLGIAKQMGHAEVVRALLAARNDVVGSQPSPTHENIKAETHPAFTQFGLQSPKLWEKIEQRIVELPAITAVSQGFSMSRSQKRQSTIEVIVFLSTDVPPGAGMRLLSSKTIDQVARLVVEEISNHTSYPALMDLFEAEFRASAGKTMTLMFSLSSEPPLSVKIFVEQE